MGLPFSSTVGVSSSGLLGVVGFTGGRAARLSSTWPVDELMLPSELTDIMSKSLRVNTSV